MSLRDTLQGQALVMLHQGHVPFPWSSLRCRSWALPCSGRIKLSKEFLFNLVLFSIFSLSPTSTNVLTNPRCCSQPPCCPAGLGLSDHPRDQSSPAAPPAALGWGRSRGGEVSSVSSPASPRTRSFSPGHQSLLSGLVLLLLQCVVMNQAQADKACINFAAVWCINTLIINYYKSFL